MSQTIELSEATKAHIEAAVARVVESATAAIDVIITSATASILTDIQRRELLAASAEKTT